MLSEEMRLQDERRIRALRNDLSAAIRAKDVDRVLGHYTADSVMMVLSPPLQFGADEGPGREGIEQWFASFDGPIGYETRDLRIMSGGGVAFCHSLIRISGARNDGTSTDLWVRETLGLCQEGGSWKVAHQHQSVPLHMDGSNRAAVELKP